ncbi:hypothetical protein FHU31_005962 [Mycolicibacterium fluoranthenivorans]|uniref:Uncharacterized protein n=1 Tax=Mycolicibacterium fluoranthenivorans TaxID=258505 RepID=A0A7X5ZG65_9MYCO|nr:hypothetical protein [Mycolicibacterium fluoranthenivorans]
MRCAQWGDVPMITDPCVCDRSQDNTDERTD